jgi:four helix bundle protein
MRDFRKLEVWERAHRTALGVYQATGSFPEREKFGLVDQLRRSAASVAPNIAEGCGRDGEKEMARHLSIAGGSASETEYHLLLARDLGYLPEATYFQLTSQINEVKKMLRALRTRLLTPDS